MVMRSENDFIKWTIDLIVFSVIQHLTCTLYVYIYNLPTLLGCIFIYIMYTFLNSEFY